MSQDNQNSNSESWVNAVKKPVAKPSIVLSHRAQERYREKRRDPEVDPNHDHRFDPVIISRPKGPAPPTRTLSTSGGKNSQNTQTVDLRKIENEQIRLGTTNAEFARTIQMARTTKKWSQDELNVKCGFPAHTIRNYENQNSKVIVQQSHVDTLRKVLGVHELKKPKNTKITGEV